MSSQSAAVLAAPKWPTVATPVIHHFEKDGGDWPRDAIAYQKALASPLPTWVKEGPYPWVDPEVEPLLKYVREAAVVSKDSTIQETDLLQDRFNALLGACATLHKVMNNDVAHGHHNPKESFLAYLVRHAISSAFPNADIRECANYALPRPFDGQYHSALKFFPTRAMAPLLASVAIEMHGGFDSDDEQCKPETIGLSMPRYYIRRHLSSDGYDDGDEDSESSSSEDLPAELEAHLIGIIPPIPATSSIPFFCFAEQDDIAVLMTSILSQRRVWGITEPILGLSFTRTETVVSFVVGWHEGTAINPDGSLQQIHIGYIGIADMLNPIVTLSLAHALGQLKDHVSRINICASGNQSLRKDSIGNNSCSWRLDTLQAEQSSVPIASGSPEANSRILEWRQWVHSSTSSPVMAPRSKTSQAKKGKGEASVHSVIPTINEPAQPDSANDDNDSKLEHQTALSCSHWCGGAKITPEGGQDIHLSFGRTARWLFDRFGYLSSISKSTEVLATYKRVTELIWPSDWINDEEHIQSVDPAVRDHAKRLHAQIEQVKQRRQLMKMPDLEYPDELPTKAAQARTSNEATWRHDLDRTLMDFFLKNATDENPGRCVVLEGMLQLPRNQALELFQGDPSLSVLSAFARKRKGATNESLNRCSDYLKTLPLSDREAERHNGNEVDALATLVTELNTWAPEDQDFQLGSRDYPAECAKRFGKSPVIGICDAIGTLTVKLLDVPADKIKDIALLTTSIQEPKSRSPSPTASRTRTPVVEGLSGEDVKASSETRGRRATRQSEKAAAVSSSSQNLTVPESNSGSRRAQPSAPKNKSRYRLTGYAVDIADLSLNPAIVHDVPLPTVHPVTPKVQLEAGELILELPLFVMEYKKADGEMERCSNQHRLYCTAAVKFLSTIGITQFLVFSGTSDGPIITIHCAWDDGKGAIDIFERHTIRMDISTEIGAWHFATIVARIATIMGPTLKEKFDGISEKLSNLLREDEDLPAGLRWTMKHQRESVMKPAPTKKGGVALDG